VQPGGYGQPPGYGQPGGYGQQPGGYGQQPGYQGFPPPGHQGERGYLQGAPVDFKSAVQLQFQNVTTFTGRAAPSAYWWYALALFIVSFVLEIIVKASGSAALAVLVLIVSIVLGLSGLSLAVRRLHDTDKPGWWLLLCLIPFIGGLVVLVFLILPGTPAPNRFG
jgi:uncharacterized membrane protein YhaH (DUF805 family)